jgi:predicted dehydrogenase
MNPASLAPKPLDAAQPASLKIAIVGCGKIADQHVLAIRRIAGSEVVALCDNEVLMARQLGERMRIPLCFADAGEMLQAVRPDVMHITTPPRAHLALARQCLQAGCHVYLEKPFTINTADTLELIQLAESKGLKITAGHNYQFTLEMLEMRRLVAQNYLGGPVVHLESYWPYSLDDVSYVGPILSSPSHWVRQLPGQLYHNLISHGVAKLAEFLDDDLTQITAWSHQSPRLCSLGGNEVQDELRVFIRDRRGTTAFFCFSTQIKPGLNILRILGPAKSLIVDHASGSLIRQEISSHKSYLTFLIPPLRQGREHLGNAWRNFRNIVRGRLHQDSGMKELIERFYTSIRTGGPPPIPYREIILTTRIMEEIFNQVYPPKNETPGGGGGK